MTPGPIVADATEVEQRAPTFPEEVERLESVGFRPIGRFAVLVADQRGLSAFPRRERDRFAEWQRRPAASILAAGDEAAYAAVDTYGDARLLRLRTELDDGSLVETIALEREGILRPWRWLDPYAGFTAVDTPERSVRLLPDVEAARVVEAHREHVRMFAGHRGSSPVRHHDRDHALRLWSQAFEHAGRNQSRARTLTRVVAMVPAAVWAAAVLYLLFFSSASFLTVLAVEILGFGAVLLVAALVSRAFAKQRWWRAPYLSWT